MWCVRCNQECIKRDFVHTIHLYLDRGVNCCCCYLLPVPCLFLFLHRVLSGPRRPSSKEISCLFLSSKSRLLFSSLSVEDDRKIENVTYKKTKIAPRILRHVFKWISPVERVQKFVWRITEPLKHFRFIHPVTFLPTHHRWGKRNSTYGRSCFCIFAEVHWAQKKSLKGKNIIENLFFLLMRKL